MILKPLQRVRVINSTKKCKAGSVGYFVAQEATNAYNGWNMCVVFTKFGKKGKPRITPLIVNPYMVDYNDMRNMDKHIMRVVGVQERIDTRIYRDRSGKIRNVIGNAKLEKIRPESKDLLDFSANEFTAYIIAMSMLIFKLLHRSFMGSFVHTYKFQPRVKLMDIHNIHDIDPKLIGYVILRGIKRDEQRRRQAKKQGYEYVDEFDELYKQQIDTNAKKRSLINSLRISMSLLKDRLRAYDLHTTTKFSELCNRIEKTRTYYRDNPLLLKEVEMGAKKDKHFRKGVNIKFKNNF